MASKELTELSKTLANTPTNTPSNPTSSTSLTQFSEDPNAGFKSLLSNEIASSLADQKNAPQTIASKYAERRRLAESAGADEQKLIESRFNDKIIDKQDEGFKSLLAGAEGQAGFSQQTAILRNISQDTDKRVKSLQKDREEAMLLGRIETAKRIDKLITDEQEAVTTAKKNYLSTLFQSSDEIRAQEQARRDDIRLGFEANAEERAQLSFETPEEERQAVFDMKVEESVLDLSALAPDAGIKQGDDFDTAIEKYRNSEAYKRNEKMGELEIAKMELDMQNTRSLINSRAPSINPSESGVFGNDLDLLTAQAETIAGQTGKFALENFQSNMKRARNEADRLNLIASTVLQGAPAAVSQDFANQTDGLRNINRALALLDEGVQTGAIPATKQYLFNIVGEDYDSELTEVKQAITAALQPYRSSITGAAWGRQEDDEYASMFGTTKYSPEELRTRLEGVREVLIGKTSGALNTYVNPLNTSTDYFTPQLQTGFNYTPMPLSDTGGTFNDDDF